MMNYFSRASLPVTRWRNGGGETREIVALPAGEAAFGWRASIATIAQDGDFSAFPGIDRIITLLSGNSVTLSSPGWRKVLRAAEPFAFSGEDAVFARLGGGVSEDFNLMTRRDRHQATLRVVCEAAEPDPATAGIAYVLAGRWQAGQRHLSAGEGAWWPQNGAALKPLSDDARMLYATIVNL